MSGVEPGLVVRIGGGWNRFWFAPAMPSDLGVCRLLFCLGILLLYADKDLGLWADVDEVFYRPMKVLGLVSFQPLDAPWLGVLDWVWRGTLLLGAVGLFTRMSLWLAFGIGFYLLALPHHYGRLEHMDGLVVILLGVLATSRCGDAISLDGLGRKRRRGENESLARPGGEYRWPIRGAQVALSLVFFAAGFAKLSNSGLGWITSDTLVMILIKAQYDPAGEGPLVDWGVWLAQHSWLVHGGAAGALALEIFYPLALFSRRARLILLPGMILLLLSFRVLIGPWFGTFILAHVFWVRWSRLGERLWLSSRNKL